MVDTAEQVMVMGYKTGRGVDEQALANRQALIEVLDQLQRGEEQGFWALFDPEASFHEASCLPYGGSHHGIEAIKAAFYTMCATFSAMHTEFHEVLTAGDYCILYQSIEFICCVLFVFVIFVHCQRLSIKINNQFCFRHLCEYVCHFHNSCMNY